MLITGGALVAGAGVYAAYQRLVNGTPVLQTATAAIQGIQEHVIAPTVGVVNPNLANHGVMATPEQVRLWCTKVGRTQGPTGINQVGRVRTSPYIQPQFPLDLHNFARFAGEGADVGLKGGTILAVLLSIETWAGIAGHGDGACYNWNFGNEKLYREQWHAAQTPPCYFLVDRVPSLDFYPSMTNPSEGVSVWANTTFKNARYNQYGTIEALRTGNIRAFCRGIGLGHYAAMYTASSRAMDARARLMARLAPYNRFSGPAVIDGSQLVFDDSIH